jgi:transcription-repair coupling factor (superfamily II helicase)
MIEEAAVHAEREREYVSRRDWGQAMKRIGVLPPTTLYRGTPDFSKLARPRKALRDYVGEAQRYAPGQRRRVNRGAKPRF